MCHTLPANDHIPRSQHGHEDETSDLVQEWNQLFKGEKGVVSRVIPATHPDFNTQVMQRWTTWEAPSYVGAIKPSTEQELAEIVSTLYIQLFFIGVRKMANSQIGSDLCTAQHRLPRYWRRTWRCDGTRLCQECPEHWPWGLSICSSRRKEQVNHGGWRDVGR